MSEKTPIEWCHHTFNTWWGCVEVAPECDNCYARVLAKWRGHDVWGASPAPRRLFGEKHWAEPLKWDRAAAAAGERRRVFCASMADVFERHPLLDGERAKLWPLIEATPRLDWLLLTKRPQNVEGMVPWGTTWPANVWLGTSCGHPDSLFRVRKLASIEGPAVRFVSAEPLLAPLPDLVLTRWRWFCACGWRGEALDLRPNDHSGVNTCPNCGGSGGLLYREERAIDWLIVGGESGGPPERRLVEPCCRKGSPFPPRERGQCPAFDIGTCDARNNWRPTLEAFAWVRDLRDRTVAAGVAFHLKQWGGPVHNSGGRLLDGRTWDEFPEAAPRREAVGV